MVDSNEYQAVYGRHRMLRPRFQTPVDLPTVHFDQVVEYGKSLPKIVSFKALHPKVLVAVIRGDGYYDFSAYVYTVPGKQHKKEIVEVMGKGVKLDQDVARVIFPRVFEVLEGQGMQWRN